MSPLTPFFFLTWTTLVPADSLSPLRFMHCSWLSDPHSRESIKCTSREPVFTSLRLEAYEAKVYFDGLPFNSTWRTINHNYKCLIYCYLSLTWSKCAQKENILYMYFLLVDRMGSSKIAISSRLAYWNMYSILYWTFWSYMREN